jgi:hypothetical protein
MKRLKMISNLNTPSKPLSSGDKIALRDLTGFMQIVGGAGPHVECDSHGTPFVNVECPKCGDRVNFVLRPNLSWQGLRFFVGFDDGDPLISEPEHYNTPAHFIFTKMRHPATDAQTCWLDCYSPQRELDSVRSNSRTTLCL